MTRGRNIRTICYDIPSCSNMVDLNIVPNNQCGAYSQQRCKHQYCCAWDYILQKLFSSYQISLSLNQSFVAKIRSISISSPCRFYFVLYCFIGFSWSPLPLRSAQSRCPLDILWSSLRYGRCKADIHRMPCTLVTRYHGGI